MSSRVYKSFSFVIHSQDTRVYTIILFCFQRNKSQHIFPPFFSIQKRHNFLYINQVWCIFLDWGLELETVPGMGGLVYRTTIAGVAVLLVQGQHPSPRLVVFTGPFINVFPYNHIINK